MIKVDTLDNLLNNLEPDSPPKKIVSGNPQLFFKELADTDKLNVGVWSSTVGSWEIASWSVDEIMMIQSGKVRLTAADDGEVRELKAGDVVFVPKGWQGTWETLEDVKKLYVLVY